MRSLFCFIEIVRLSEVRVSHSCLSSKNFKEKREEYEAKTKFVCRKRKGDI